MAPANTLQRQLEPYAAKQLEVSPRGDGTNATWLIQLSGQPVILKTYGARRGPVKTALTGVEHFLSARTGYTAAARHQTELRNLELWRQHGCPVPKIVQHTFSRALPARYTCMEFVEGPQLGVYLKDAAIPLAERLDVFRKFLQSWGERHARAVQATQPKLIQEHAMLDHVLINGDRFVTFDLEVSYTSLDSIQTLVAREICGYLRSLYRMGEADATPFLEAIVAHYPHREYLQHTCREFVDNSSPLLRLVHRVDRWKSRHRKSLTKYQAAGRLRDTLKADAPQTGTPQA